MTIDSTLDWARLDAEAIANMAASEGAGRVVLLTDGNFSFAAPDLESIAAQIKESNPQRYKLQKLADSRWTDLTKYLPVSSAVPALVDLGEGNLESNNPVSIATLARAASSNPDTFHYSLKTILKRANFEKPSEKSKDELKKTVVKLDQLAEIQSDVYLKYVIASLDLQECATGLSSSTTPSSEQIRQTEAQIIHRTREVHKRHDSKEAAIAKHMALGKVHSLKHRESAEHHFEQVRSLDSDGIIQYFYIDMGAMTYFHDGQISEVAHARAGEVRDSIKSPHNFQSLNNQGILMSIDPHFFRIYAPVILFYAQQMPNLDYNLLICGDESEFENVKELGLQFSEALNRLNLNGIPENIFYHRIPVPGFVTEKKTFFASARFFGAGSLIEKYENLYIMDADLTTGLDPRPYFSRIKSLPFAVPRTSGSDLLSPWRRYGAGNVTLNKEVLQTPILEDLQGYLAHGLSKQSNWMLDQNALCYTIEKNPEYYTNLSEFNRPFGQPKFRSAWEKNYWQSIRQLENLE